MIKNMLLPELEARALHWFRSSIEVLGYDGNCWHIVRYAKWENYDGFWIDREGQKIEVYRWVNLPEEEL
jgi:hypothetical protein